MGLSGEREMKTIITERYQCEICNHTYDTKKEALDCEQRPLTTDSGVIVGDVVRIIKGSAKGKIGTVNFSYMLASEYGHTYWHSRMIMVDIENDEDGCI